MAVEGLAVERSAMVRLVVVNSAVESWAVGMLLLVTRAIQVVTTGVAGSMGRVGDV